MAEVEVYVGTEGPFILDDVLDADLLGSPSQVARREDIDALAAGALGLGSTVTAELTFGLSASTGTDGTAARSDHTHGTPADPLAAGISTAVTVVTSVGPPVVTKTLTFTNGLLTAVA